MRPLQWIGHNLGLFDLLAWFSLNVAAARFLYPAHGLTAAAICIALGMTLWIASRLTLRHIFPIASHRLRLQEDVPVQWLGRLTEGEGFQFVVLAIAAVLVAMAMI